MNILKEEEYVSEISAIVEAKYFPDRKKMDLISNLIDAEDVGNVQLALATSELIARNKDREEARCSLDKFLRTHTSEDNKAFERYQEKSRKETEERYWWLFRMGDGEEVFNNLMFMPRGQCNEIEFKKPRKRIVARNTRLDMPSVGEKAFFIAEPTEKEQLAIKLAGQSFKSSASSSRHSTPRTPNSNFSPIFPILNYQIPSKRLRNQ